jgi:hypothetical protein
MIECKAALVILGNCLSKIFYLSKTLALTPRLLKDNFNIVFSLIILGLLLTLIDCKLNTKIYLFSYFTNMYIIIKRSINTNINTHFTFFF